MTTTTPIGHRLSIALDDEYRRMQNEWFFRWHSIGRNDCTEIDGFDGRMIRYGGVRFFGTPRDVYWDAIQRYLRQKVGNVFDDVEIELQRYPLQVRRRSLHEANDLVRSFAQRIRRAAIEKDRVLRGNGFEFPPEQDLGQWHGSRISEIQARVDTLIQIYCEIDPSEGQRAMVFDDLMNDSVTLVDRAGNVIREDVKANVQRDMILTSDASLPVQVGDHFLRKLPSGLVEDYVVDDPGFIQGLHGVPGHYQSIVRRTDARVAPAATVIQYIHGDNAKVYSASVDNSSNTTINISSMSVAGLLEQIRPHLHHLPEEQRLAILSPIELLESEIRSGKPDPTKMRGALQTMVTIAEGAAGNLVAAGIVGMIGQLL